MVPLVADSQARASALRPYLDYIRDHIWASAEAEAAWDFPRAYRSMDCLSADLLAKLAEPFLDPAVFRDYPALTTDVLTRICRNTEGRYFQADSGKLVIDSSEPSDFRIHCGSLRYHGNLERGEVFVGCDAEYPENFDALLCSGNYVNLVVNGYHLTLDVEEGIVETKVRGEGGRAILTHLSVLKIDGSEIGLHVGQVVLGSVTYTYSIDTADPAGLDVTVTLTAAPDVVLSDVHASISLDQLDQLHPTVSYAAFRCAGTVRLERDGGGETRIELWSGATAGFELTQPGPPGSCYTIRVQPAHAENMAGVFSEGRRENGYHQVYALYRLGTLAAGATGWATQRVIVTGRHPDPAAQLNFLAHYYLLAGAGQYGEDRDLPIGLTETRSCFDRNLKALCDAQQGGDMPSLSRYSIAFCILALDAMFRATGDPFYRDKLTAFLEILVSSQADSFPAASDGTACCLAAHAAGLLTIARLSLSFEDQRFNALLERGVDAIRLHDGHIHWEGDWIAYDSLTCGTAIKGRVLIDDALCNYKLGLVLRSLAAIRLAVASGRVTLKSTIVERLWLLEVVCRSILGGSTIARDGKIKVLTTFLSRETNAETQAAVVLGLFPPDTLTAGMSFRSNHPADTEVAA